MNVATTATEAIKLLWKDKFFGSWKEWSSIDEELDKRGYHFASSELGMALNRAKFLTRKGKLRSYQYIQKHPYIEESRSSKR